MIYLTSIITGLVSILVCCLSWYLIRINQNTDLRRQENRKLNRLIFNLLELRFWIDKEIDIDQQLGRFLDAYELEITRQAPNVTMADFKEIKTKIKVILKQQVLVHSEIPAIEGNLDAIIKDLAEVDPAFAFELTGKYRITAHTARIKAMMDAAGPAPDDSEVPLMFINDIFRPKMLLDLQKDLRVHFPEIVKKADKKTRISVKLLPEPVATDINIMEASEFLKGIVPQLLEAKRVEDASKDVTLLAE